MWSVYILSNHEETHTYVGATVDVERRLRQHNSELSGGAKYTTSKSASNKTYWKRVLYLEGFQNNIEALQFEWALKYHSRKVAAKSYKEPLEKRMFALQLLLGLPIWQHIFVHKDR